MNRVRVLVEGQTEKAFVREVLKPHFDPHQIYLHAVMLRPRGGMPQYTQAKEAIVRSLKEDDGIICTTMVDFYGMPTDWPGRDQENRCLGCEAKADIIEKGVLEDIAGHLGDSFDPHRLIPYVQMHEYEALLFSSPEKLADNLGDERLSSAFLNIRKQFKNPEEINDDYETCPSRRIEKVFRNFRKTIDGVSAAYRIGLEVMRQECPHFNEWITKLESIEN